MTNTTLETKGNYPVGVYSPDGNKISKENRLMKTNLQTHESSTKNTDAEIASLRELVKEGSIKDWVDAMNNYVRSAAKQGDLTEDECRGLSLLTEDLVDRDDFSNEDEKYLRKTELSLMEDIPHYAHTMMLNELVLQMHREEPDEDFVRGIVTLLRVRGYSYKQIKQSVNKTLTVEKRKRFRKILPEIKDKVETYLALDKQTDELAERFGFLENEPWKEEKALKEAIEGMSWATEMLLRDGRLDTVAYLEKKDGRIVFPLITKSEREKAHALQALQMLVDKTNPDVVTVLAETWVASNENTMRPSENPERKEAIVVSVETPLGIWQGLQYFSRDENDKIVLDKLIAPEKANLEGCFVFMDHEEERVQCNA